ncbi:unnamed protein product, partial [marine sediment metagenome]
MLIILESTVYPGTTEEILLPILESKKLKAEKDFYLAYSPERIDLGNKRFEVGKIPKVVGGIGEKSLRIATLLYREVMGNAHPVSSPKVAEATKLLENTFRTVNIAFVNEVAIACRKFGIDVWEVIEAARSKPFGFMAFYPGPGAGGPCLLPSSHLLTWKAKNEGLEMKLLETASALNEARPAGVVEA